MHLPSIRSRVKQTLERSEYPFVITKHKNHCQAFLHWSLTAYKNPGLPTIQLYSMQRPRPSHHPALQHAKTQAFLTLQLCIGNEATIGLYTITKHTRWTRIASTTDSCAPDGGQQLRNIRTHEQSMNHICTLICSVCVISRGTKFESVNTKPPHLIVKRLHLPMPSLMITTKEY